MKFFELMMHRKLALIVQLSEQQQRLYLQVTHQGRTGLAWLLYARPAAVHAGCVVCILVK